MKKLYLCMILTIIIIFSLTLPAYAKDYYFPKVNIEIHINKDGSFNVVEERTYHFSGSFHWATYSLEKSGFSKLTDFSISDENGEYRREDSEEPGTYLFYDEGTRYFAKFFYSAENEDKTFIIKYKILDGLKVYLDTADFYWKLIGKGWEKKTKLLTAKIYLPESTEPEKIYVFGHGPLNGVVERMDGTGASYEVSDVPPHTFVEARVLFPPELLDVSPIPENKLDEILSYERGLAQEANRKRVKARIYLGTAVLIPVLFFIFWLYIFFKYGKEYKGTRDVIYVREPPEDLPPAIVGYLMRFKKVTSEDFTATIMNLVRKGYISMEVKEKEVGWIFKREKPVVYLTKTDKDPSDLRPHERIVYDFLFTSMTYDDILGLFVREFVKKNKTFKFIERFVKTKDKREPLPDFAGLKNVTVSTEDITKFIKKHPEDFKAIFEAFKESVKKEGEEYGYFEKAGERWMGIFVGLSVLGVFLSGFILMALNLTLLIPVYIAFFIILTIISTQLMRRTRKGKDAFTLWNGLRKFMNDFSNLKEAIPTSIVLWEKYLVYAVTFGIAEKVIEQLKIILPEIPQNELSRSNLIGATVLHSTYGGAGISSLETALSSMVTSFNTLTRVATSSTSSSGGGGGFSGGGGGGGGGSGGGAG
ncbi:MAG: DUF2207 domain-containing protein [Caldisericia bacterium]|nr:DUF2207 domain-containing protein [Caldisericia bacterium]